MIMLSFEKLEAYQLSREYVRLIYRLSDRFPAKEYYANLFDHILSDGIFENETDFGFPLSPENIGVMITDEFKESLLKDMLKRWKR